MENKKFAILNGEFKDLYGGGSFAEYDIICTEPVKKLSSPLAYHPDIQIAKINGDTYVCEPTLFDYYSEKLEKFNVNLICGNTSLESNYPKDIAYNVARVEKKLFCFEKYTDKRILENFDGGIVNINQGYSRCNMCIVNDEAVITSDDGIYLACAKNNIDVLKIEKGHIKLFPYEYGFIGGASYNAKKGIVSFFGNLKKHPSYKDIISFCQKHGCTAKFNESYNLCDLGSAIFSS